MASNIRGYIFTGGGGAGSDGEAGLVWGRSDDPISQTFVPVPDSDGTAFSWPKTIGLFSLDLSDSQISNRRIGLASDLPAGLHLWWQNSGEAYIPATQPASPDSAGNASIPGGYAGGPGLGGELTATPVIYDLTELPVRIGRNGAYLRCALGVDHDYLGTVAVNGTVVSMPPIILTYDESP